MNDPWHPVPKSRTIHSDHSDHSESTRGELTPSWKDEINGFLGRLRFALAPLGTGILLDLLDALTFGPIGLCLGGLVGATAGWWLAKQEGLDSDLRLAAATVSAAYMTLPFTEVVPAAMILMLVTRFFAGPSAIKARANRGRDELEGKIEKSGFFFENGALKTPKKSPS